MPIYIFRGPISSHYPPPRQWPSLFVSATNCNNPDKFPARYMFELSKSELCDLRSKVLTTNVSQKSRSTTKVFTDRGLYMLATILKGEAARDMTFAIIETFAKVRELKHELLDLHKETDKSKQQSKMQHFGEVLTDIVMPDLQTSETESSLEINFLIGKIKHTVKRVRKESLQPEPWILNPAVPLPWNMKSIFCQSAGD